MMMMDVMMVVSESVFHFQGLGTSWWWTSWAGSTSRTGRETPSGEFPLTNTKIQRQIQKDEYKHTHYQGGKVKMSQRWRSKPLLVRLSDWGTVLSMGWEIWIQARVSTTVLNCENLTLFAKVEIPGTEGRAGMVAIPDPERKVDVEKVGGLPWYPL